MSDDEGAEAFCRRMRPQLVGVLSLHRSWWRRRRAEQRAYRRQAAGQQTTATDSDEAAGRELRQAVTRLPCRQREALVLTVVAGYSTAEAGEVMGCAPGTVKALCAQHASGYERRANTSPATSRSATRAGAR